MLKKIYYCWRILVTGSAFLLFNVGGLFLTLVVFPIIRLAVKNRQRRSSISKLVVHKTFRFFVGYMSITGLIRIEGENLDVLSNLEGKIVIANHPSLIDVVILISMLKQADCVVKSTLWKAPFIRGVVSSADYIRNDVSPDKFIERCKSTLASGNCLIIFPEGTRTEPGCQEVFKRGAANIAIRTGYNFQPITISISPSTLTKDKKWYQVSPTRLTVKLKVMPEFNVESYMIPDQEPASVRKLTRDLSSYYLKELHTSE